MDNWKDTYKKMLMEAEEGLTPADKVDALDDILYKVVVAMNTVLNGKNDREDEQALEFLTTLDDLTDGRLKSKFSAINKKGDMIDKQEKDKSIAKIRPELLSLFRNIKNSKNKKDASEDSSGK